MLNFKEILLSKLDVRNIDYIDRYIEHTSKNNISSNYTEKHHILPKSVFPEFKNEKWNIVKLSGRDHFIAHYLLMESFVHKDISYAFNMMKRVSKRMGKADLQMMSESYEKFRDELSLHLSEINKGRTHSVKSKTNMGISSKNKVVVKDNLGNTFRIDKSDDRYVSGELVFYRTGLKYTKETKNKMSKSGKESKSGGAYYNEQENKIIYLKKDEEVPLGYLKGCPPQSIIAKERFTGLKYYVDSKGNQVRVTDEEAMLNCYTKGRNNFGENGNFFEHNKFVKDLKDSTIKHIHKDKPYTKYMFSRDNKFLYRWDNFVSAKQPNYYDEKISLDEKEVVISMLDKYERVDKISQPKRKPGTKSKVL